MELRPFSPPGSRPYRDGEARLTVRVPDNRCVARGLLLPLLTEPHELVSLGTSAAVLRQGDESCPHVPEAAVKALGPQDALISLLEHESDARPPARPKNLLPPRGARAGTSCSGLQRPAGFTFSGQSFKDQGRAFYLYVAIGEAASDETRREAAEVLDSLTLDP